MSDYLAEVPWHLRFLKDVKSMKTLCCLSDAPVACGRLFEY